MYVILVLYHKFYYVLNPALLLSESIKIVIIFICSKPMKIKVEINIYTGQQGRNKLY